MQSPAANAMVAGFLEVPCNLKPTCLKELPLFPNL